MNTVKERVVEYICYKKISKSDFCRAIGVSVAFVSSIRTSIQPDKIKSIALNFPDLNTGWLMTGEGEMLKDEQTPSPSTNMVSIPVEAWEVIKKQADSLASKDRQVEELISLLKKDNAPKESNAKCANAG